MDYTFVKPVTETRANIANALDANRIRRRISVTVAEMAASSQRLLDDLEQFPLGEPPLIDGKLAIVEGEPVDLVEWLRNRVTDLCLRGTLAQGLEELANEASADPLSRLAQYVRLNRR